MISIDIGWFWAFLIILGILGWVALVAYYNTRDYQWYARERERTVFYCVKCNTMYSERERAELAVCPRCKFRNTRLRF